MMFIVDDRHLGTPEESWMTWEGLDRLAPLQLAPVDRALVVAPHPDDEVLGAGGLVSALVRTGTPTTLLAVTDGEGSHPRSSTVSPDEMAERRRQESQLALVRLDCGAISNRRLHLPDGQVHRSQRPLTEAVIDALDDMTLCIAPWERDGHPDHDASGQAAVEACAHTGARLVRYLVWAWHWAGPDDGRIPWSDARRLDLSRRDRARKRWACGAFVSQISPLSDRPGDEPVLPGPVLRRAWRPFEVYLR